MFKDSFWNDTINASLNETYICLIPRKINAKTVHDDKPISLTHCAYEIIVRVLRERLSPNFFYI